MKKKKILIVSHDAGGAEYLSSWVSAHDNDYTYLVEGPAQKVYSRKVDGFLNQSKERLTELISHSDTVITSTSWSSNLEKIVIKKCLASNNEVFTMLDHWTNYRQRFFYDGLMLLPSEIWVCDDYAYNIAKKELVSSKLRRLENYYFMELEAEFSRAYTPPMKPKSGIRLLFISQPLDLALKHFSKDNLNDLTDQYILDVFLKFLKKVNDSHRISQITIRVHPSDSTEMYEHFVNNDCTFSIDISSEPDLVTDINTSDWVIGSYSMALVIALKANRKVFSCLPLCCGLNLPHDDIQYISSDGEMIS